MNGKQIVLKGLDKHDTCKRHVISDSHLAQPKYLSLGTTTKDNAHIRLYCIHELLEQTTFSGHMICTSTIHHPFDSTGESTLHTFLGFGYRCPFRNGTSKVSNKGLWNPNSIETKSITGSNKFGIHISILCLTEYIGWRHLFFLLVGNGLAPSGLPTPNTNLINFLLTFVLVPFTNKDHLLRSCSLAKSDILCHTSTWIKAKSFLSKGFLVMT